MKLRVQFKCDVLTERLFLKRDTVTLILRIEAEHLPSVVENVSCFHMKGKHCAIRGVIHAADDGSPHPTQRTVVCVFWCECVCVCGHLSALKWSVHCGRVTR